jgi:hypothetical protein
MFLNTYAHQPIDVLNPGLDKSLLMETVNNQNVFTSKPMVEISRAEDEKEGAESFYEGETDKSTVKELADSGISQEGFAKYYLSNDRFLIRKRNQNNQILESTDMGKREETANLNNSVTPFNELPNASQISAYLRRSTNVDERDDERIIFKEFDKTQNSVDIIRKDNETYLRRLYLY